MKPMGKGRPVAAVVATAVLTLTGLLAGCGNGESADRDGGSPAARSGGPSSASVDGSSPEGGDAPATTVASSARLADAACADAISPTGTRSITDPAVTEASGLAVGPGPDPTIWLHNDSGDDPRVFSVTGEKVSSHTVPDAEAVDWEDMAIGPDGRLYIGDIGDNGLDRSSVQVYRFSPPDPGSTDPVADVDRLTLTYDDRPHNAEALMIDPVENRIVVIAKGNGRAGVFSAPLEFDDGDEAVLEMVTTLATGDEGLAGMVTAADMSVDGGVVLVRTYSGALLFRRPTGTSLEEALSSEACPIPTGDEGQGEAIAVAGEDGYLTIGEGARPKISEFAPTP